MKKFVIAFFALAALVSCQSLKEEWQPVVQLGEYKPAQFVPVDMDDEVNTTIAQLKAKYTTHGKPVVIEDDIIIKGEVISSDEDGNVYRELYIQDESGAICIKIGRSSSYDDYKVGQILYVKCEGLCLGEYGYKAGNYGGSGQIGLGMLGDGYEDYLDGTTDIQPDYETSYIDLATIINKHIFRGVILPEEERIQPLSPAASAITATAFKNNVTEPLVGKLTKLSGLKIGTTANNYQVFALYYPNPNLQHDNSPLGRQNRIFLSESNTGGTAPVGNPEVYPYKVITWGLTKNRTQIHLEAGDWDDLTIGDSGSDAAGHNTVATRIVDSKFFGVENTTYKDLFLANVSAQSLTHYFTYGTAEIQVRTSGYARFADVEIPEDVLNGSKNIDIVGILSRYQGSPQFILLDAYYAGTTNSIIH